MKYRYECQLCDAEFFRAMPNVNELCRKCGNHVCLDWSFDMEEKTRELMKPLKERLPLYRDDGPSE